MLMDLDLRSFLGEVAGASPAPGGGSVSALAGSLACALAAMVARLTVGKVTGAQEEEMERVGGEAHQLMESLNRHVDEDTRAFNRVMAAYRMARLTEAERRTRSAAVQEALKGAAGLPLRVAGECLQALRLCRTVAVSGNPNALSDAGVASLLAYAGVAGAMLNVAINLAGIDDAAFVRGTAAEKERLMAEAVRLAESIKGLLRERLPYVSDW